MTSSKHYSKLVPRRPLVALLTALLTGCYYHAPQGGTWVGRVVPVTVFSHDHVAHEAAALQVESGPAWAPRGPDQYIWDWHAIHAVPAEVGGGFEPLLVKDEPSMILTPDKLPLGKRVRVKGWMGASDVSTRYPDGYGNLSVSRAFVDFPEYKGGQTEHFIQVRSMKILDD